MDIPHELVDQFARGNGVIFVGAGLSIGAGLPGWGDLVCRLAAEIEGCPTDVSYQDIAQYYVIEYGRHRLVTRLREELDTFNLKPTSVHEVLVRLPINSIFTTNCEDLLEQALRTAGRKFDLVVSSVDAGLRSSDRLQLVKLHGDLSQPESIVITAEDYERYSDDHPALVRLLEVTLQTRTVLFLGYSVTDPDFRQLLTQVRSEAGSLARNAFAVLFKAVKLTVKDLERRGIRVINLEVADGPSDAEATRLHRRNQVLTDWLGEFHRQVQAEARRLFPAAKQAFELAVTTWQTEQVLESSRKLDWFYQYGHNLDIGANELLFLLLSETQSQSRDLFGKVFRFSQPDIHNRCLRWINLASPTVCIQVLDRVLESSNDAGSDQKLVFELVADLCCASSFEVQRELVAKLEEIKQQPVGTLYRRAYQASPIPTQASLSYLQDLVLDDLPLDTKRVIAYRILEHYRVKLPTSLWGLRPPTEREIQDWVERFPVSLLDNEEFRNFAFDYLKQLSSSSRSFGRRDRERLRKYRVELFKLLYDRDPDRMVETMWDMVERTPYIGLGPSEILQLLRIYDPQRTIEKVVRTLSQERRFHSETSVALLEAMKAPEADDILIKDLERYVQRLEGGSKQWRGGGLPYWRKSIRKTVQAVARRRLEAAVPHLATIVLRYEPQNLKLDCLDALVSIGGENIVEVLVKLLDDRFTKVRNKASKYLLEMNQQRDVIVTEIIKSIAERKDRGCVHQAKRSDAMERKINTLRRLRATQAIEVLEQVAQSDDDESVRKLAARAVQALRKM